jgi:hypothetical protein
MPLKVTVVTFTHMIVLLDAFDYWSKKRDYGLTFATIHHSVPCAFKTMHALTQHRHNYVSSAMCNVELPSVQARYPLLLYSYLQAFDEDGLQRSVASGRTSQRGRLCEICFKIKLQNYIRRLSWTS